MLTLEDALRIVITAASGQLSDLQETVFKRTWQGQSYLKIAQDLRYDEGYIKAVGAELWQVLSKALGEKVGKRNLQAVLSRHAHRFMTTPCAEGTDLADTFCADWGEIVDVSEFWGRGEELVTLSQWILQERCRLVAILGMGGIGKTTLAAKFAQQFQGNFECVVWRSLLHAPPLEVLLPTLLQGIDLQSSPTVHLAEQIQQLLGQLQRQRCLLILDNVESILCSGRQTGVYRCGYENYGDLLRQLGDTKHHSTVLLTSREKPKEIAALEGPLLPIRSLKLQGLQLTAGTEILRTKGLAGRSDEQKQLIECYQGNPLALKMVATSVQELFGGDVAAFLAQDSPIFSDLRHLLNQQFDRLDPIEHQIMDWLAINREAVTLATLQDDMVPTVPPGTLLDALKSLCQRSLIERSPNGYIQQPVILEYVTEKFVETIYTELLTQTLKICKSHALLKAQAKDYVRETQKRLIVQPILEKLLAILHTPLKLEAHLKQILVTQQAQSPLEPSYVGGNILNLLRALNSNFKQQDFSRLSIWQADLRGVDLHHTNFSHSNLAKSTFTQTLGDVLSVAFSPDGNFLATSDISDEIHVWRMLDSQPISTLKSCTSWIKSVVFSSDGQTLISSSEDQTVKLWNIRTGQLVETLQGHTGATWCVASTTDGHILASSGEDQTIKLWDLRTGQLLTTLQGHTDWVLSLAFSPDNQQLASGSHDQTIKLWDLRTEKVLATLSGHRGWIAAVAFSPDGQLLASGSADRTVRLWNLRTQQWRVLAEYSHPVTSISLSPNGQLLASASEDASVKIWDVRSGHCVNTLHGHTSAVWSVQFSPNGQTLASGGVDQTVRLWDVRSGHCLNLLQGYTNSILWVSFSPNGQRLVSSHADQQLRLWDMRTGECLNVLAGHTNYVSAAVFSPNNRLVASCSDDQTVRLWNSETGQELRTLRGHAGWVSSVSFSPNGQLLASSSMDCTVRLWNLASGQCLSILKGHTNWIPSVSFSADGRVLASGSTDRTVRLWDVQTGQCFNLLQGHSNQIASVAFNPQGRLLASGSDDQTVRLWDVQTGECLKTLMNHTDIVRSVAYSPDGKWLVSGGGNQALRCWDVSTGEMLRTFQGPTSQVHSIAVNPNGQLMASAGEEGVIRLWDVQTGQCLRSLTPDRPYEGADITGVTGLTDAQKATLQHLGAVDRQSDAMFELSASMLIRDQ
jgi:WD40 repeat protein